MQWGDNSFDLTYEELKPGDAEFKSETDMSFDLTYEELKLYLEALEHFTSRPSFDLTYEELKQYYERELIVWKKVLILPMRN